MSRSPKAIIDVKHDEYWPFYHVEHKFGRVILTINTAHPFFTELYEPVRNCWATTCRVADENGAGTILAEGQEPDADAARPHRGARPALLSLARTQGRLASTGENEARKVMDDLRREWSGRLSHPAHLVIHRRPPTGTAPPSGDPGELR